MAYTTCSAYLSQVHTPLNKKVLESGLDLLEIAFLSCFGKISASKAARRVLQF